MSLTELAKDAANPTQPPLPPHLQKAMGRVTEISALPEITTRIVDVVENPRSTARDMHEIVKNDPALATKILKVVNSAFYGLPSQIASLDRAIVMLGLSAVKNIALAASLSRLFRPEPISEQFQPRDLWSHCMSVGVASRMLAKAMGRDFAEEAFVAGLVHDMGLMVVHQLFPDKLRQIAMRCFQEPQSFRAAEVEVIGADHEAFGAALATKWKFPPGLRSAIANHHDPLALKQEFRRLACVIHVADTYCCQKKIGFWLTAQDQVLSNEVLSVIGQSHETLPQILADLEKHVAETEALFSDA